MAFSSKKELILNFLKELDKPTTIIRISKILSISYPTVLKWIDVLNAEGKIEIQDLGNVKLINLKKEDEND